jgi:recombination protein RecT
MANNNLPALKSALNAESIQKKFNEMLGKKSAGFITSITNVVQNNDLLQKADVNSIILAAAQAASLDLPINPNLGFSAIVPYNDKKKGVCVAQFQIQRDGWVDLCLRTGQFEYLVNEIVYEGELVEKNRFTDTYIFDETKRVSDKIIGYMASFKLTNGYKKTVFWTVEECKKHGMQYSQTFKKHYGLWVDNFNAMSLKTVLKHLLKKFAPKSIESIAKAIESDQASFVGDINNAQPMYADNQKEKEQEKVDNFEEAEVVEEVNKETGEVKKIEEPKEVKVEKVEDEDF